MKHAFKLFGLMLLLLSAQQGAVVHELGHLAGAAGGSELVADSANSNAACALCPAFAQASSPTFSHSFTLPHLARATPEPELKPQFAVIDAAVPTARSRGPPV